MRHRIWIAPEPRNNRYRLTAINGLGEELLLGETAFTPRVALSAWPLPYRGKTLNLSFATFVGRGGGSGLAEVVVYDLQGRLVRTIVRGNYEAGQQTLTWDGRDETGFPISNGVYFLRAMSAGESTQIKLVVVALGVRDEAFSLTVIPRSCSPGFWPAFC